LALATAVDHLRSLSGEHAELIVVDDGSPYGEAVELSDLPEGTILISHPVNLGKGA